MEEFLEAPVYAKEISFQVYKTFKLGPGTSETGNSLLYTRTTIKDNHWFRYTAYHDPNKADDDISLDFAGALASPPASIHNLPARMMAEVSTCHDRA